MQEVALVRRRTTEPDESDRRLEAVADAAAERFAEHCGTPGEKITLLRKRVSNSHERERALKAAAEASDARIAERGDLLNEVTIVRRTASRLRFRRGRQCGDAQENDLPSDRGSASGCD